jgi:hypothetical protein
MNNVLHLATANGHAGVLKTLLQTFKDNGLMKEIDSRNSAGNTPLRTIE